MSRSKRVTARTQVNTLIRFDFQAVPVQYHRGYPFIDNEVLLFLGEVRQMPGHCVVATKDGRVVWGYHTENFVIVPKEEA
jgi:hypothetical protein